MVSPIDARDYEPVEGLWAQLDDLRFVILTKVYGSYGYGKDALYAVRHKRHTVGGVSK